MKCKAALMELFRDLETTMQKMGIEDHIEGTVKSRLFVPHFLKLE